MNRPTDELMWTAYRYSAGELSEPESLAFEALLADDQQAREALATAVGLSETIYAVERYAAVTPAYVGRPASPLTPVCMPASASRTAWYQSAGWVALGAAACLALMFVLQGFGPQDAPPGVVAQANPADDQTQLLLAMLDHSHANDQRATGDDFMGDDVMGDDVMSDDAASSLVPSLATAGGDDDLGEDALLEPEVFDSETGLELSLDDANVAPDWLLAAVAESKS